MRGTNQSSWLAWLTVVQAGCALVVVAGICWVMFTAATLALPAGAVYWSGGQILHYRLVEGRANGPVLSATFVAMLLLPLLSIAKSYVPERVDLGTISIEERSDLMRNWLAEQRRTERNTQPLPLHWLIGLIGLVLLVVAPLWLWHDAPRSDDVIGESAPPAVLDIVLLAGSDLRYFTILFVGVLAITGAVMLRSRVSASPTSHQVHGSAEFATVEALIDVEIGAEGTDGEPSARVDYLIPASAPLAPGEVFAGSIPVPNQPDAVFDVILPATVATQHTIVLAGSGAGKTTAIITPNAAWAVGSKLIVDMKGEVFRQTSGLNPESWRFAPLEPDSSLSFNWIPLCTEKNFSGAYNIAAAAMGLRDPGRSLNFWELNEVNLCLAVFLHAATLDPPTPVTAYRLLADRPSLELARMLLKSPIEIARRAGQVLAEAKPDVRTGVVGNVVTNLNWLNDPRVQRFTSSSIVPPDLTQLRRRPIAVYWCVAPMDVPFVQRLASIFFTVALDHVMRPHGSIPVLCLLDEFANMGVIPQYANIHALSRGYGVAIVLALQSLAQLETNYGAGAAQTILDSSATTVYFHGLSDAKQVSDKLGSRTESYETRSRRSVRGRGEDESISEHLAARPLLTPDEVRTIGVREILIVTGNRPPIRAQKVRYNEPDNPSPVAALGPVLEPMRDNVTPALRIAEGEPTIQGAHTAEELRAEVQLRSEEIGRLAQQLRLLDEQEADEREFGIKEK